MANLRLFWILSIAAAGTAPLAAQEQKITPTARAGFQLRIDSTSTDTKETGKDKTTGHAFNVKTARFAVAGDLTPSTNYLVRLDVKNAGFSATGADGAIASLDRAYIASKLCENFDVKIGRIPFTAGSIEWDYSSIDQYVYSYFAEYVASNLAPMTAGVEANYSLLGQTLGVQVVNGYLDKNASSVGKDAEKDDDKNVSAYYRGRLFDGMIKPIVSYDSFTRIKGGDDTNDGNVVSYAVGVGTQISVFNADIDVEYDTYKGPSYSYVGLDKDTKAVTPMTKGQQEIKTMVGQVAYNWLDLALRPLVKVTSDKEQISEKDSFKSTRLAAGAEYAPGPKGFRYHAIYVSKKDDNETGAKTITTNTQQIILGVAAKM